MNTQLELSDPVIGPCEWLDWVGQQLNVSYFYLIDAAVQAKEQGSNYIWATQPSLNRVTRISLTYKIFISYKLS